MRRTPSYIIDFDIDLRILAGDWPAVHTTRRPAREYGLPDSVRTRRRRVRSSPWPIKWVIRRTRSGHEPNREGVWSPHGDAVAGLDARGHRRPRREDHAQEPGEADPAPTVHDRGVAEPERGIAGHGRNRCQVTSLRTCVPHPGVRLKCSVTSPAAPVLNLDVNLGNERTVAPARHPGNE